MSVISRFCGRMGSVNSSCFSSKIFQNKPINCSSSRIIQNKSVFRMEVRQFRKAKERILFQRKNQGFQGIRQ